MLHLGTTLLFATFTACSAALPQAPDSPERTDGCKCFPGDDCWPSLCDWDKLNQTVKGRLVATVPLASPCYPSSEWDNYGNDTCSDLQNGWLKPAIHIDTSHSAMAPFFANQSILHHLLATCPLCNADTSPGCDPFRVGELPCVVGTYVQYAIDVATPEHAQAGLAFADEHNIRLVIRNTGHDYNGKSTGAGALGLWMHHLKDIEVIDYEDAHYSGKALHMGAGVEGLEAYVAADAAGLHVVGGTCPSVGLTGGYSQGGGHSPLSSYHGLGADQILEFEVVTAEGEHLICNREQNTDLYWAMSGGGGGTFAVAMSTKYKAHPDVPFSGMTLNYQTTNLSSLDAHYEAVEYLQSMVPSLTARSISVVWYFEAAYLIISPITAPKISASELRELMAPLEDKLTSLSITFESTYTDYPTFLSYYNGTADPSQPIDVGIAQYGGRLIPRETLLSETANHDLAAAFRYINEQGGQFIGVGLNVSEATAGGDIHNSVLPAWRTASIATVLTTPWNFSAPWEEMEDRADLMTEVLLPAIDKVVLDPKCYLNEGDFQEPNWRSAFYGENYPRLLEIKQKYDPKMMLYATTGVGQEFWEVGEDYRLCWTGGDGD